MLYENYYEEDPDYVIQETLSDYDECKPTVVEVISEVDEETGLFKDKPVYNCYNCVNVDCPYFYEMCED